MAKQKKQSSKGAKTTPAAPQNSDRYIGGSTSGDQPADPLRAYPADPPQKHRRLLIVSVILFVAWFCYLAYLALGT